VTSSNAVLTQIYPPVITAQPTNQLVLLGSNTAFGLSITGTAPFHFQWRHSATNLINQNNAVYLASLIPTNMAGNYSVVVSNQAGMVISSNAILSVIVSPKSQTNQAGTTATFMVSAIGAQAMNFQWQKNGTNLIDGGNVSGALTNALNISSISPSDVANYRDIVSNGYGSVTSLVASLKVTLPAGYNKISGPILGSGIVQLPFVGIPGWNYALDRSFSLAPPNWLPQVTNPANSVGVLIFTNAPDPGTNNFWRIRSVP
jgi:hypothetical protein